MKTKILGLFVITAMLIATSCSKATDDKIEEVTGVTFTVNISGGDSYKAATAHGEMKDGRFVITSDHGEKEIYLYVTKFEKGEYKFSDTLNTATYTFEKSDSSKIYTATQSPTDYIKITKIHTDGKTFDGEFKFSCTDSNGNVEMISGAWINVVKK